MARDPPEPIAPRADEVQASTTKSFMAEMVKKRVWVPVLKVMTPLRQAGGSFIGLAG